MVGLTFQTYQPGDCYKVRLRHKDPLGYPIGESVGPAWTAVAGDKVVLTFGFTDNAPGIATIWAFISDDARGHALEMIRFGRKTITRVMERLGYHRIQCVIRADRPEYLKFAQMYGFQPEGLMRKATPDGDDIWMYSIVTE